MFKCRKATPKDIGSIVEVMQDTRYAQTWFPGKSFIELKKIISELMKTRTYFVCVEERLNRVVGYFVLDSFEKHSAEVELPKKIKINKQYAFNLGVGVHSAVRGKGVATKLTKYVLNVAKRRGYKGMYADVCSNNEASIKLQEKCGFCEIARYRCSFRPKGTKNVFFKITF